MNLVKIMNDITFVDIKDSSIDDIKKIRHIRNNNQIRKNMINKKIISYKDHIMWYHKMISSKINFFYIVKYAKQIIGGLGLKSYNSKLNIAEWSFYILPEKNFIGLGATLEFKSIEYLLEKFDLKKLYCYVLGHNLDVIKLHSKFGFNQIVFDEYQSYIYLQKNIPGTVYFSLDKNKWDKLRKLIYQKYFK